MKKPNDRLNDILIVVGILVAFMAGVKIYVLDPNPQILGDFLSRFQRATEAPIGQAGTSTTVTPAGLTPIPSDTLSASATPYLYVTPAATFTGIAPSTPISFTLMPPPTFVAIGTLTPTPTNNPNATHTHTPTPTPTATVTPTATNTRTATPTWTNTPVDTPTDTPTDTPVPPTSTPTDTPIPPTATPTDTPLPPDTPTPTP